MNKLKIYFHYNPKYPSNFCYECYSENFPNNGESKIYANAKHRVISEWFLINGLIYPVVEFEVIEKA